MRKQIYLESVEFAMLLELAKKRRLKPDQLIIEMIQKEYKCVKRNSS